MPNADKPAYLFEHALLPVGWRNDVLVTIDDTGNFASVAPGARNESAREHAERVRGHVVPGVPNVHSHAHQRAMAGLAEHAGEGEDSFWSWREAMYAVAGRIGPDELKTIATQLYVEMLEAGYTSVGEFHYLHHRPDGTPYPDGAELSLALLEAAGDAGIGITLLPTLYASSGFGGAPANDGQRRFANDAERFLAIVQAAADACARRPDRRIGISPHSLRAVPAPVLRDVLDGLDKIDAGAPVHMHVAEQTREVDECIAWSGGMRPVEWLLSQFDVNERWCLVHATHVTPAETRALAGCGAVVALCPSTEANLGDGIFPARDYMAANGRLAIGSDSHITVSPAGELRLLEYTQRLTHRARNVLAGGAGRSTARTLLDAVLAGGAQCLAQNTGAIAADCRADFLALDSEHASLVGSSGDRVLDAWVFSGGDRCVRDVFVGGRCVVRNGRHAKAHETLERYGSFKIRSMIGTTSPIVGPVSRKTSPSKSMT